jgi:ribosome-associated translation inhibitor RaiA
MQKKKLLVVCLAVSYQDAIKPFPRSSHAEMTSLVGMLQYLWNAYCLMSIMMIQVNADHNLKVHADFRDKIEGILRDEMDRFKDQTTRLEVHLSDENGNKESKEDKRCMIEARLEGSQPIVASDVADTYELALNGAIEKLRTSIEHRLSRLKSF